MNKYTLQKAVIGISAGAAMLLGIAMPAAAETKLSVRANANIQLSQVQKRSDAAIDARIQALTKLSERVDEMKRVSVEQKTTLKNEAAAEIANLTALKAKIDADTDITVAKADEKKITSAFRIYMLVVPQGYILASADRIATIGDEMNALSLKLQTRIDAAGALGKNVASVTAKNTDIKVQVTAALSAAASAKAKVVSLLPDNGDASVEASNKAALVSARADIGTARDDLVKAHVDIKGVLEGLKALK